MSGKRRAIKAVEVASLTDEQILEMVVTHMRKNDAQSSLPEHMQGIFWMDGNQPENFVTLDHGKYQPELRKVDLPISGTGTWMSGERSSQTAHASGECTYHFQFNDDFTYATIRPSHYLFCIPCKYPDCMIFFDMVQHTDDKDFWDRKNKFCCKSCGGGDYALIRILKPNGTKVETTPHFARACEWLRTQGPQYFWTAVHTSASVAPLPQDMVR